MIYLDNAATTRPYPEVLDRMREVAENQYANPHALHAFGVAAERAVTDARRVLADCLKAQPQEIFFTSGGTESNNQVIQGCAALPARLGRHILTTAVEHPAVLEPVKRLEAMGFEAERLPVTTEGIPDMAHAASRVRPDTRLLSLMLVNNETGAILPVAEIVREARKRNPNLLVHVDAVQAFGKLPVVPKELGADFVSLSAHKLHGPKGVGLLYVRKGVRLDALLLGGGQEGGMRSGTLNVPGICGFATAAAMRQASLARDAGTVAGLKRMLADGLRDAVGACVQILSPEASSPYLLLASFEKAKAEVLLHHLAERGIMVSSGSACASRKDTRSHVIKAMAVPEKWQAGILRFSFSAMNTEEEIRTVVEAIREIHPAVRHR